MENLSNHIASITMWPSLSLTVHVIFKERLCWCQQRTAWLSQSLEAEVNPLLLQKQTFHGVEIRIDV